jgi:hypothetical protein
VGAIFPVLRLENHTEVAKTEGFVKGDCGVRKWI